MKKVVHINTFPYKATGNIMLNIHAGLQQEGYTSYVIWGRGRNPQNEYEFKIGNDFDVKCHGIYTRLTDKTGFASKNITKRLIRKLDEINPQVLHLHNLHGYYINIAMLFNYIKKNRIQVIWTLHDCWAFTGHCAYFDYSGCEKWKTGCNRCNQKKTYPASMILDNSRWNWEKKKEIFTGADIQIVTPCNWLKKVVEKSFLKDYPIHVIYNGIDTNIFYPRKSDIKERYNLGDKKIILGVASEWAERKGLNDFLKLSEMLPADKYQIVLIGLNENQLGSINSKILGLTRTENVAELANWYSAADLFVNPTYEDNFPTTNLEAVACGTPVITYETGGSPESIIGYDCGMVIAKGEIQSLKLAILSFRYDKKVILNSDFNKKRMIEKYIALYKMLEDGEI